ncbi:ccr4-not transcription subunit 2 c terminal not2 not3 domains [Stylonychia lemnae]|uniref:Ccr4-not transcription subunit 2 c terminal not2 not3 domains n=1 Tax=Stylonychia lemnae TaxID=5949 RepID=A0A078AK52_STYLE|nr:ccr4-not transcription subunit 2 c terminal not2 not3 domains [Stylonychia lemnae]|eukprot:CDW82760.1 ccr4-not transcription subunit 2 c terminal not2 not3 domains [Stylonychia lemnae]
MAKQIIEVNMDLIVATCSSNNKTMVNGLKIKNSNKTQSIVMPINLQQQLNIQQQQQQQQQLQLQHQQQMQTQQQQQMIAKGRQNDLSLSSPAGGVSQHQQFQSQSPNRSSQISANDNNIVNSQFNNINRSQGSFSIGANTSIIQEAHNDSLSSLSSQYDLLENGMMLSAAAAANLQLFSNQANQNTNFSNNNSNGSGGNDSQYGISSLFNQFQQQSQLQFNVFDVELKSDYDSSHILSKTLSIEPKSNKENQSQLANELLYSSTDIFRSPNFDLLSFEEQILMNSFKNPASYEINVPSIKTQTLKSFDPNILFYIFYNFPHDKLQIDSHNELINRGWMYHKDTSKWYILAADEQQSPPQQQQTIAAAGSNRRKRTMVQSLTKCWYIFDTEMWKRVKCSSSSETMQIPPTEELNSSEIQIQPQAQINTTNSNQPKTAQLSNSDSSSSVNGQGIGRGSIIRRKQTQRGGRPATMGEFGGTVSNQSVDRFEEASSNISYKSLVITHQDD